MDSIQFYRESTYSGFQYLTYSNIILNRFTLIFKACTLQFIIDVYQYWMPLPTVFINDHPPETPHHNSHHTLVKLFPSSNNILNVSLVASPLVFGVDVNLIHQPWIIGCMLLVVLIKLNNIKPNITWNKYWKSRWTLDKNLGRHVKVSTMLMQ